MPQRTEPLIVVVTGASGAGKTTIVRALGESAPHIACHHFDSIGVPPMEEMIRAHGGPEAWQRATTRAWMERLRDDESGAPAVVLDAGTRPSFAREAFAASGIRRGHVILIDCLPDVRRARLVHARGQPELATPQMDMWSAYLRGQADALELPVLDTTGRTVAESVAALRGTIDALLARDGRAAGTT